MNRSTHPPNETGQIPFEERLTCTVAEACSATGIGKTKLYELMGDGQIATKTVGRRRLVLVRSLIGLVGDGHPGHGVSHNGAT